jgi:hypothetical protein
MEFQPVAQCALDAVGLDLLRAILLVIARENFRECDVRRLLMPFGFIENEPVGQPLAGFVKIRCAEASAACLSGLGVVSVIR